jgi:hypothetical protein
MDGDAGTTRTDDLAAGSCISDSPCAPQHKRLKKVCSCSYSRLLGPSISSVLKLCAVERRDILKWLYGRCTEDV